MKRRTRLAISVAAGVGVGLFSEWFTGAIVESPQKINASAMKCAGKLGDIAVTSETVPEECKDWTFPYHTLPSRDQFLRATLITPAEQKKQDQDDFHMSLVFGGIGFAAIYGFLALDQRTRREQEATESFNLRQMNVPDTER